MFLKFPLLLSRRTTGKPPQLVAFPDELPPDYFEFFFPSPPRGPRKPPRQAPQPPVYWGRFVESFASV